MRGICVVGMIEHRARQLCTCWLCDVQQRGNVALQINQMLVVGRDAVEQAKAKVRTGACNLCYMRL